MTPRPRRSSLLFTVPLLALAACASGGAQPCAPAAAATPALAAQPAAPRVIVFVRHAEKVTEPKQDDPPLTEVGVARAAELARVLGASAPRAIYATEYQRTQATARPLAEALHMAPIVLPAKDEDGLVARLSAGAPGETIVVVGHSNTIPDLVAKLGVTEKLEIGDLEYDGLFVVTLPAAGAPKLVHLRYGR